MNVALAKNFIQDVFQTKKTLLQLKVKTASDAKVLLKMHLILSTFQLSGYMVQVPVEVHLPISIIKFELWLMDWVILEPFKRIVEDICAKIAKIHTSRTDHHADFIKLSF